MRLPGAGSTPTCGSYRRYDKRTVDGYLRVIQGTIREDYVNG